ncbi:MAG: hypothetical protein SFW67_21780 [Myxococcaceae bacterium]|nr:hypothetical protein [Myxococcaceae bacterium]
MLHRNAAIAAKNSTTKPPDDEEDRAPAPQAPLERRRHRVDRVG